MEAPSAGLVVADDRGGRRLSPAGGPPPAPADAAEDEDQLSGRCTEENADTLAALFEGRFGLTVKHLAAGGTPPLAVLGEARVIDRFRSGSGGLSLTPA
ncbi:hypothetical protein [Streptomyces sp. NPDC054849]